MKVHHFSGHTDCRVWRQVFSGLCIAAVGAFAAALPHAAIAQEVVVGNQGGESRGEYRGPNWSLLTTGLIVFGGTYTASVAVAASSDHAGDKGLYAPLAGPWLDIANRCPNQCNDETGRKVLLGFDGVFQGLGVLTVVSALLFPRMRRERSARLDPMAPTFRILPTSVARAAPGLVALGTF